MHKRWAGCMDTFKTMFNWEFTKLAQSRHSKQFNFVDHIVTEERRRHWMKSESRCLSSTSPKPPFLFALVNIYLFVYFCISLFLSTLSNACQSLKSLFTLSEALNLCVHDCLMREVEMISGPNWNLISCRCGTGIKSAHLLWPGLVNH